MIRRRTRSPQVLPVQTRLRELGYLGESGEPLALDGIPGRQTWFALTRWAADTSTVVTRTELSDRAIERLLGDGCEPSAAPTEPRGVDLDSTVEHGAFLWEASKLSVSETVELAQSLGLSRVYPKIMNKHGKPMYARIMEKLIPALQEAGLTVYPWAYLDDIAAGEDAVKFADLCDHYGCDGAIANMEKELVDGDTPAERRHDAEAIDQVLSVLTSRLTFVGFSSFRRRDFFPYPREVFERYRDSVTFMAQCYNLQTAAQSEERVEQSASSWLDWGLQVRMTLGAFPPAASKSGTFGSYPKGIVAAARKVAAMSAHEPALDSGVDSWCLEKVRAGEVGEDYRAALREAHGL